MANRIETQVYKEMALSAQNVVVKKSFELLQTNPHFIPFAHEMWGNQSAIVHNTLTSLSQDVEGNLVTTIATRPTAKKPAWKESSTIEGKYLIEEGKILSLFIRRTRWIIKDIPHGLLLFLDKIPQAKEGIELETYLQSLRIHDSETVDVDMKGTIFLAKKPLDYMGSIMIPDNAIHPERISHVYVTIYNDVSKSGTLALNPPWVPFKKPLLGF